MSSAALTRIDGAAQALAGKFTPRMLAESVSALSRVYTRDRGQLGQLDKSSLLARAGFFFPRDLAKVFGPLDELLHSGAFPAGETLRVLDLGAGMGATSFGLARWLRARAQPVNQLRVVALEQNASALRGFNAFAKALHGLDELVPVDLDARAEDLRSLRNEHGFQLVLFGFVLNELFADADDRVARRAKLVREAYEQLSPDGALIILEPALKETTRELMQLRDALVDLPIVAPCLHGQGCPMLTAERDWCHQELPYALPPALAEVAQAASLRWEGLSYSSLVLSRKAPTREPGLWRVVSDRLATKGKLELYGCGQGEYTRFTQLNRKATPENHAFTHAERSDILRIEGGGPRIEAETKVERL
ncbi:MAG TPA: class I SAM-dependent methyltransferase [Polyangiales bacterium]|nr:class I SAM-dependent methyltransferase [Polyangiales bacterium]